MSEETKGSGYLPSKTLTKAVSAPAIVIVGAEALSAATGMDKATCYTIVTAVYGVGVGFINWLKHRKDK